MIQRVLGRGQAPEDEVGTALAGTQLALERKRRRWIAFLSEQRQALLQRREQQSTSAGDPPGTGAAHAAP